MTDTPFAITLDPRSSLANHTGTWRSERPVYADGLPPCSHACPAGEQVQSWLYQAEDGGYERAWRRLVADNPFPAVMGRICYHPCEAACNRGQLDVAVGINSVERFLGDHALEQGWTLGTPPAPSGRRVLVVGAGPAGLAAAYHARRAGHEVEVHEAGADAGGLMRTAIPPFRLPRDVLDLEIERLLEYGIALHRASRVDDLPAALVDGRFDAAVLAVGAGLSHRAYLPAVQAAPVLDALAVLAGVADGARPRLGRRVVVYGGGNTAMDAARTARRLGAEDAVVVYRRDAAHMPAQAAELEDAIAEGVQLRWLSTIRSVDAGHLTLERMTLDERGVPVGTGELETLDEDAVVLALGQDVDTSLLERVPGLQVVDGLVQVDRDGATGNEQVWAAGDVLSNARTAAASIGSGARAAAAIDRRLRDLAAAEPDRRVPVPFTALNAWYFSDAPHAVRPRLDAARGGDDFAEVVGGLDEATALYEARRCLSCGNCFGCDNCFGVCPDNSVLKIGGEGTGNGHGYAIDYDYCKGCGMCVSECPAGAILMVPEDT